MLKIGLAQIDIAFGEPAMNEKKVEKWVKQASEEGCSIVVFPELWNTGYDLTRIEKLAEDEEKKTSKFLASLSRKYSIDIVGGSIATKSAEGVANSLIVTNQKGDVIKQYSKLHLFKLMDEHHYLHAGNSDGLFELQDTQMAGLICYDIRFPEWFRKQVLAGAKVVFVAAEWPAARITHWQILLQARAIENQCFVIACNRVGRDPNNEFGGCSLIINPWGEILSKGTSNSEELVTGDINLNDVDTIRDQIPIFQDRRPEFY